MTAVDMQLVARLAADYRREPDDHVAAALARRVPALLRELDAVRDELRWTRGLLDEQVCPDCYGHVGGIDLGLAKRVTDINVTGGLL